MKLLRVGPPGAGRPAALNRNGRLVDPAGVVDDLTGVLPVNDLTGGLPVGDLIGGLWARADD